MSFECASVCLRRTAEVLVVGHRASQQASYIYGQQCLWKSCCTRGIRPEVIRET